MGFLGQALGTNSSFQANAGTPVGASNIFAQNVALNPQDQQQQQALVAALQSQMAGTGPNPANQTLQNALSTNANQTNAQISGARGINPGLALRQGQQNQTNAMQGASGQAAAQTMQQQLNATGQLGNQLNTMQQQNLGAQQANQQANLAANQANQQANLSAQSANQQAGLASQGINAGISTQNASNTMGLTGGVLGGAGAALGLARGGLIPMADGGILPPSSYGSLPQTSIPSTSLGLSGPASAVGQYLKGSGGSGGDSFQKGATAFGGGLRKALSGPPNAKPSEADIANGQQVAGGPMDAGSMPMADTMVAAHGGRVPALVSPGERYLPPSEVKKVSEGKKSPMKAGEKIQGKPKVGGARNSYANDTVPKTLESGGIVLPRSVTQAKDAPAKAAEFVRAVLAKQNLKR